MLAAEVWKGCEPELTLPASLYLSLPFSSLPVRCIQMRATVLRRTPCAPSLTPGGKVRSQAFKQVASRMRNGGWKLELETLQNS